MILTSESILKAEMPVSAILSSKCVCITVVMIQPYFTRKGTNDFLVICKCELAEGIGLKGAKLFHGMTDGNASAIATGCIEPGDFGIGCGTTTVPRYVSHYATRCPLIMSRE